MIDSFGVMASKKLSNCRSLLAFRMPGCGQFTLPLGDKKIEKPIVFWGKNMAPKIKTKAKHGGGEITVLNIFKWLVTLTVTYVTFACFLKIWFLVKMLSTCNCLGGWYLLLGRFFWSACVSLYTWCFQQGCSHHCCGFKSIILNHCPKISTKPWSAYWGFS